ncbi:MAG: HlyD family efflux transporter periplasmic adaptor subunit [Burkholderiales bacterium]|nr:HlyD family efflux transporter periplasmic adaptor subunit [Anaerolineae bacterium]
MNYRVTGLILLLVMALLASCQGGAPEGAQAEPTSTPIPTAPAAARPTYLVQRGDVQEIFEFTGRWQPRDQLPLSFEVSGTIRQVNVQRGDTVTAGELLADLQITSLEEQLASAQLSLETALANLNAGETGTLDSVTNAQINLANARLELENSRNSSPWPQLEQANLQVESAQQNVENAQRTYDDALSHPEQPASTVDNAYEQLLSARNNLASAQASYYSSAQSFNSHQTTIARNENAVIASEIALDQARSGASDPSGAQNVRQAQLNVEQIEAEIARSSLYAPIDGEILEVTIVPGDAAQAYVTIITIGRSEPKEVIASLAIGDANRLSVGMIGVCQVTNQPATAVQCAVRRLPLTAQDADQTTRVAASLEGQPSGQLIEVDMPLQVRESVLWLPPAAVRTFQNRTFVVLQTADGERAVDVEIGLQTDDRVEIVSGVNAGDVVIAP